MRVESLCCSPGDKQYENTKLLSVAGTLSGLCFCSHNKKPFSWGKVYRYTGVCSVISGYVFLAEAMFRNYNEHYFTLIYCEMRSLDLKDDAVVGT